MDFFHHGASQKRTRSILAFSTKAKLILYVQYTDAILHSRWP